MRIISHTLLVIIFSFFNHSYTEFAKHTKAKMWSNIGQRFVQFIKEFLPALKVLTLTLPLSIFDFGTDVLWTQRYLTSSVDIVKVLGVLLLVALLFANCVASFYGLSILIRQHDEYPRLWKTRSRRVCTCLLHLLGLGSVIFHLDYLVDWLSRSKIVKNWRHGRKIFRSATPEVPCE